MKPQVVHEVKELYSMRQQGGRNEVVALTVIAQGCGQTLGLGLGQ